MTRKRMLIYSLAGTAAALLLLRLVVIPLASGSPARFEQPPDLAPHTDAPNLVTSRTGDAAKKVEPFALAGEDRAAAFKQLVEALAALPRAKLITQRDNYAHLTFTTPLWGFVDDVEVELDAEAGVAHVKSASRLGYSDLGANRARVEKIRAVVEGH